MLIAFAAVDQQQAAGALGERSQQVQIGLRADGVRVDDHLPVGRAVQKGVQFVRGDQSRRTHSIADVKHVATGVLAELIDGRFETGQQIGRPQRSAALQAPDGSLQPLIADRDETLFGQTFGDHIHRIQGDPIALGQGCKNRLQHGQRLLAMGAHLAGGGIEEDHVVPWSRRRSAVANVESDGEIVLPVVGAVCEDHRLSRRDRSVFRIAAVRLSAGEQSRSTQNDRRGQSEWDPHQPRCTTPVRGDQMGASHVGHSPDLETDVTYTTDRNGPSVSATRP